VLRGSSLELGFAGISIALTLLSHSLFAHLILFSRSIVQPNLQAKIRNG
jgi:hypothetical protein